MPFIDDVRKALADILPAEQVSDARESKGKVIVTIAADIPMPEKPAFANKVKERVGRLSGVESVLVHFQAPAQPAEPAARAMAVPLFGQRLLPEAVGPEALGLEAGPTPAREPVKVPDFTTVFGI